MARRYVRPKNKVRTKRVEQDHCICGGELLALPVTQPTTHFVCVECDRPYLPETEISIWYKTSNQEN